MKSGFLLYWLLAGRLYFSWSIVYFDELERQHNGGLRWSEYTLRADEPRDFSQQEQEQEHEILFSIESFVETPVENKQQEHCKVSRFGG